MKKALSVLLLLIFKLGLAQNLVPNPSFEFYTDCPTGLRQIGKAEKWYSSSFGTPEYFNCSFYLNAKAHSGTGLVAIIPFGVYNPDLEFISVKLSDSLKKGNSYCVEFYIQPDIDSPVLVNNIGAYFSEKRISVAHWNYTDFIPQVVYKEIAPAGEWTKISSSFIAQGGEQFMNIGNFFEKEKTSIVNNARPKSDAWFAYYYLDDFQVIETQQACIDKSLQWSSEEYLKEHVVRFNSNAYKISNLEQENLIRFIKQLPVDDKIQLKLVGHTDSDASEPYNLQLSMSRVEEVEQFLKKTSSFNLITIWNGENNPINNNFNEFEKQKNRRVEISVIL